jgi:hypothetical protein
MNLAVSMVLLYSVAGAVILAYAPFLVVAWGRLQTGYDQSAPLAAWTLFALSILQASV